VVRVPTDASAARNARWLAELSDALEQAQRLVRSLGASDLQTIDVLDLLARIEAASDEARELRLGQMTEAPSQIASEWTSQLWDEWLRTPQ
jgi:hypothetical protein